MDFINLKLKKEEKMKKLMFVFAVLIIFSVPVYAEQGGMGGGMMGGQQGQMGGMEKGQMMEHKGMMEHGQMMGGMMDMSKQMSDMMGNMSGMMKDMPADRMKSMSGVMKDMSHQMMEMSKMMSKGAASEKDMKRLHDKMGQIQKRMSEMGMKK